ncbi:phosphoribosylanthranilate isomerase [Aureibacter tunicatorum]|uniref:N-(5'-phosphoribosyl)anthranilate isomerase n=1 Tax=Aureibacter tunicatorum TaxID=866807 RepID=A0AAE3XMJ2_9BACT|nr:phosphoribosylanthranilate isomerase [Aureibacter tunicatorum]MDR6239197.1 phosphoribosylanthranilate isomerase [Aureibacter tunicatorum]BDD04877.1 N-(5'-phosphoribosyl)anthranilate isomerase [Aureibacter tunicatorum]
MKSLKLKVCGMREEGNILDVVEIVQPDYLGFIFYPKSPRFVGLEFNRESIRNLPANISKVGVFVNATAPEIIDFSNIYGMNVVQLHGDESPEVCLEIKNAGFKVIKAFGVGDEFDFEGLSNYTDCVDYFLFDTKGKSRGGNGILFNWQLLKNYPYETPFFLSGGVDVDSLDNLEVLEDLPLVALDVNSKFEIEPALKDVGRLENLALKLKEINNK